MKLLSTLWVKKSVISISLAFRIYAIKLWECSSSEKKFSNILRAEWKSLLLTLLVLLDKM